MPVEISHPLFDARSGVVSYPTDEGSPGFVGTQGYYAGLMESSAASGKKVEDATDQLRVVFGGFSPTSMGSDKMALEMVERSNAIMAARKEMLERAAALEAARASERRVFEDGGVTWHYVVLDESKVRIEGCDTANSVVHMPETIEGMPVEAVSSDGISGLAEMEELYCAPTVTLIAPYAFRANKNLRKLVLPRNVATYDSTWVKLCGKLEDLTLPGGLDKIGLNIFDGAPLKRLVVGESTMGVVPGAFVNGALDEILVSAENPFLRSDGHALYTKDGQTLLALTTPVKEYAIAPGCTCVAKKGMSMYSALQSVSVPSTMRVLGEFAFARTSIREFQGPEGLDQVCEKAFFQCTKLEHVSLGVSLRGVGSDAFTGTCLRELRLPATMESLGVNIAGGTSLTYTGDAPTFSIAAGSERLWADEQGCLYSRREDGIHCVRLLDPQAASVEVAPGTRWIDEGAFAKAKQLQSVRVGEGVECIGKAAFKGCRSLTQAHLPQTLKRIEAEAFMDSVLEHVNIPASLEYLGEHALVTWGAHHGNAAPSLAAVDVEAGQETFYLEPGMLLERRPGGRVRLVTSLGGRETVRIPREVTAISSYAFSGQRGIRQLFIGDHVQTIGVCGLAVDSHIELIHITYETPVEGHTSFDIRFPATSRGRQQLMLVMGMLDRVDVAKILRHYDCAIISGKDMDAHDGGLSLYDQSLGILARLQDPVFMSPMNRSMAREFMQQNLVPICVGFAKGNNKAAMEALFAMGFVDGGNIDRVIDAVGSVQDAAMTGYLLEQKRERFGVALFDFDL